MNEMIHLLDPNLNYVYHELIDDVMYIFVESTLEVCTHTTFAERFDFINHKSKKTKRLEDEIIRLSLNCSSVTAAKHLSKNNKMARILSKYKSCF